VPASFEYDPGWLGSETRFMLDPRLELWPGEQHPPAPLSAFEVFLDSASDRWGRVLMERREALDATREGRTSRTLHDLDFPLGLSVTARATV